MSTQVSQIPKSNIYLFIDKGDGVTDSAFQNLGRLVFKPFVREELDFLEPVNGRVVPMAQGVGPSKAG